MQVPVSHADWQVLRAVARGKGKPVAGTKLRIVPSRATKDGTFLTKLVEAGFLEVVKAADDPFDASYRLTAMGTEGAEYGLCEIDFELYKKLKPKKE
jgi:hypothetical protein